MPINPNVFFMQFLGIVIKMQDLLGDDTNRKLCVLRLAPDIREVTTRDAGSLFPGASFETASKIITLTIKFSPNLRLSQDAAPGPHSLLIY